MSEPKFSVGEIVACVLPDHPADWTMVIDFVHLPKGSFISVELGGYRGIAEEGYWYKLTHFPPGFMTHEQWLRKYDPPDADIRRTDQRITEDA